MTPRTHVPATLLRLIAGIALADLAALLVARALGWSHAGFVPMTYDVFADFFKYILSFPGGAQVPASDLFGLGERIAWYQAHPNYTGIEGLAQGRLTHLHGTPLTVLACLAAVRAMAWIDPALLFAALLTALAGWWIALSARFARDRREAAAWSLAGLLSYPAAMVLLRGNLYAGAAGILIVQALLAALRGRSAAAAIPLALACCIRPNAAVFLLPLLALRPAEWRATLVRFVGLGGAVSLVALAAAHALYPDYSLATFRAALDLYYRSYVVNDLGVNYGSSAYGALKHLFGYRPGLDTLALIPAAVIGVATLALAIRGRLQPASLIFLTAAAYTLGSTIIADYPLLPFLAAPMALAREGKPDVRGWAILLASALVLSPKNLWFADGTSPQDIVNPAVLLAASLVVLVQAARSSTRPAAASSSRFSSAFSRGALAILSPVRSVR